MKEVNFFECEICGKHFEDDEECLRHELQHSFSEHDLMGLHCYNERMEEFEPFEVMCVNDLIFHEKITIVVVDDLEAAKAIKTINEAYTEACPSRHLYDCDERMIERLLEHDYSIEPAVMHYNDTDWDDLVQARNEVQAFIDKAVRGG